MEKVVLACFDFFRDEEFCLSKEIYDYLKKRPDRHFEPVLLPVDWREFPKALEEVMQMPARGVLFLGNGRGSSYRIEKIGINAQGTNIRDNQDRSCEGDEIIKNAPTAYFSTWNIEKFKEEMNAQGLPCIISYYSGVFLCNGSLYRALHYNQETGGQKPITLLHLTPERRTTEDLPQILKAVLASL